MPTVRPATDQSMPSATKAARSVGTTGEAGVDLVEDRVCGLGGRPLLDARDLGELRVQLKRSQACHEDVPVRANFSMSEPIRGGVGSIREGLAAGKWKLNGHFG